ncbi:MAG TPA: 3'-5' exonuclease [Stellaceae bacterium]
MTDPFLPVRYVDTETAGGRAGPESILEIAIVDETGMVLLDTLIDPGRPIDPFVVRIHGITDDMVQGAPRWDDVAPEAARLLAGTEFVAHSVAFDRAVVGAAAAAAARFTCTVSLCRRKLGRAHKLRVAAEMAGHVPAGRWHRAAADALACRSVHRWLVAQPDLPAEEIQARRRAAAAAAQAATDLAPASGRAPADPRLVRLPPALCPEPVMTGRRWTVEMDETLRRMWRDGCDVPAILAHFLRTPSAIFARLERLGMVDAESNPYHFEPG